MRSCSQLPVCPSVSASTSRRSILRSASSARTRSVTSSLTTTAPVILPALSRMGAAEFWIVRRWPSNVLMSISSSRLISPAAIARRDAHSSGPIAFPEPCQKPSLLAYRSCPGTIRRPQIRLEAGLCRTTSPARSTTATPTGSVSSTCRSCDSASLSLLMSIIAPTARRARPWASRSMTQRDATQAHESSLRRKRYSLDHPGASPRVASAAVCSTRARSSGWTRSRHHPRWFATSSRRYPKIDSRFSSQLSASVSRSRSQMASNATPASRSRAWLRSVEDILASGNVTVYKTKHSPVSKRRLVEASSKGVEKRRREKAVGVFGERRLSRRPGPQPLQPVDRIHHRFVVLHRLSIRRDRARRIPGGQQRFTEEVRREEGLRKQSRVESQHRDGVGQPVPSDQRVRDVVDATLIEHHRRGALPLHDVRDALRGGHATVRDEVGEGIGHLHVDEPLLLRGKDRQVGAAATRRRGGDTARQEPVHALFFCAVGGSDRGKARVQHPPRQPSSAHHDARDPLRVTDIAEWVRVHEEQIRARARGDRAELPGLAQERCWIRRSGLEGFEWREAVSHQRPQLGVHHPSGHPQRSHRVGAEDQSHLCRVETMDELLLKRVARRELGRPFGVGGEVAQVFVVARLPG